MQILEGSEYPSRLLHRQHVVSIVDRVAERLMDLETVEHLIALG